ncbi:hypothetical protein SK128_019611, partial [Halocaridina rubra]
MIHYLIFCRYRLLFIRQQHYAFEFSRCSGRRRRWVQQYNGAWWWHRRSALPF